MNHADLAGIGGHALLLTAVILRLLTPLKLENKNRLILASICLILALIPLGQLSIAQFSRGVFGDISIASIIILGRFLLLPNVSTIETRQTLIFVVVTGTLFYPAALGLGMIDPYQWGYLNSYQGVWAPLIVISGLIAAMIIGLRIDNKLMMLCISMALVGYTLNIMESKNIWDYMIDPLLFIYGFFSLCTYSLKQLLGFYRGKKFKLT